MINPYCRLGLFQPRDLDLGTEDSVSNSPFVSAPLPAHNLIVTLHHGIGDFENISLKPLNQVRDSLQVLKGRDQSNILCGFEGISKLYCLNCVFADKEYHRLGKIRSKLVTCLVTSTPNLFECLV
jgi:hypothetical protein